MCRILAFLSLLILAGFIFGGTCSPQMPPPPPLLQATLEQEPNDTLAAAQGLDLSAGIIRVAGTVARDDIDLYSLGDLKSGDRVIVSLDPVGTDARISMSLFEVQSDHGIATIFQSAVGVGINLTGTIFDGVIRFDGSYDLGIVQRFGSVEPGANYDVTVEVQSNQPVPVPTAQLVVLNFNGGSFVAPDGVTVNVGPLDGTDLILDTVAETTRTNFAGYGVQVLRSDRDTPPADQPFSTVFFGPILSGAESLASDGLGVAVNGVDDFNRNRSDVAVVFSPVFTPDLFGVPSLTEAQLGTALGNVASHEIGHLLGLQHVFDPTDIMNTLDSPATLLNEQHFKRSTIHFFIFDPLQTLLSSDAPGYLHDIVGNTRRLPDLEFDTGDVPFALAAADLDLDGAADLEVANQGASTVSVYANLGDRSFTEPFILDVGAKPLDIVAFETEFETDPVIITANPAAGSLSAFYLTSEGFEGPAGFTAGASPRSIAAGDLDGDTNTDLAVANFDSNDVTILLSDGVGGFVNVGTVMVGANPQGIVAADLDGDGRLDLAVTSFTDNTVRILQGHGNGGFTTVSTLAAGNSPIGIIAADLNKDGKLDLAVASNLSAFAVVLYDGSVLVFMNEGDFQFAPQAIYAVGAAPSEIAAADLNGDGHIDLATANNGDPSIFTDFGNISLLFNRGDGTFGQDTVLEAGLTPSDIVIRDLDGRGLPDIAVVNRNSATVSIFFNE